MQQPQPRQQSRFNEIQMLQRQIMFKQLQELQRQQKIQELGDARQQNYINQQALLNKQASGAQFSPLANGTHVHDASQMYMFGNTNMGQQHGTSPLFHGFPNGLVYSQAQSQPLYAMGLVPQQLDGTPVSVGANNFSPYPPFQGLPHDTAHPFTKQNGDQAEKSVTQLSALNNSYMNDQCNVASTQEKNLYGQGFNQSFDGGVQPENRPHVISLQRNSSLQQLGQRQEHGGDAGHFSGKTENIGSQCLDSLDPLEQKILFNMDDDSWESSFGRQSNTGTGGFGNMFENTDQVGAFPSIQSGSWSALMQSAVAEASSSDTGIQEEWSGFSFQNSEPSNDKQPVNFVENGKQPSNWLDNNVHSGPSPSPKPEVLFNNASPNFHAFQIYPGAQFPSQQEIRSDASHESIKQSPKDARERFSSKKETHEGSEPVQRFSGLQSTWPGKNFKRSQSDAHQSSISSYANNTQPFNMGTVNRLESQSTSERENVQLKNSSDAAKSSKRGVDIMYHSDRKSNVMATDQPQLSSSPRIAVSAYKAASDGYGSHENSFQRENSIGSYHSNTSQHTIAGPELRDTEHLQETDSYRMSEGDQKSSGQVPPTLTSQEQGHDGEFEFIGNASNSSMDFRKGFLTDTQRNFKASKEATHIRNVSSGKPAFFNGTDFPSPNSTAQIRHNMLELLHKVDKFTEHSEASFGQSYNKSSTSQYFGLGLAPPVQRPPKLEPSLISPQMETSSQALQGPQYDENHLHNQSPVAPQFAQSTVTGTRNKFPDFNPANSQEASHLVSNNPCDQSSENFDGKQLTHFSPTSGMSQQVDVSMRPPSVWRDVHPQQNPPGMGSHKMPMGLPSTSDRTNSWPQTDKQSYFKVENSSQDIGAGLSSSQVFGYEGGQAKEMSGIQISGQIDPVSRVDQVLHEKELISGHQSPSNAIFSGSRVNRHQQVSDRVQRSGIQHPAISARALEDFGRSLKQSHVYSQRIPVLNPMHSDPCSRASTNNNRVDSDVKIPQVTATTHLNSFPYGDHRIFPPSSTARVDESAKGLSQPLFQDTHQDMVAYDRDDFQSHAVSNDMASNDSERPQISFPTAPSWFNNYETLKNGQMLAMYSGKVNQQLLSGRPLENFHINSSVMQVDLAGTSQVSTLLPPTETNSVTGAKMSSPCVLDPGAIDQNLSSLKPKKRKLPTLELLPWHKEVIEGSSRVQNISTVELEWSHAANRLPEMLNDEGVAFEESHPTVRTKRRLTLTTQLMQMLFRPAPAVVLSQDAISHCDTVAYFSARLALGDACGLASRSRMSYDISGLSTGKGKKPKGINDQEMSKIVDDLIDRSTRLDCDISRLEEGQGTILDARVEAQELEKFSVINRFAKFHIRGQVGAAETMSGTGSTTVKLSPQRYVTMMPMPSTVPEGAQCLSL